jgi:hypothetical protein
MTGSTSDPSASPATPPVVCPECGGGCALDGGQSLCPVCGLVRVAEPGLSPRERYDARRLRTELEAVDAEAQGRAPR